MGVQYCTIAQVKETAKQFSTDFHQHDPQFDTEIANIIDRASNEIRMQLQARFDFTAIDADVPLVITRYCEVLSAKMLLIRQGYVSKKDADPALVALYRECMHYKQLVHRGSIFDSAYNYFDASPPTTSSGGPADNATGDNEVDKLYQGGRRGSCNRLRSCDGSTDCYCR